MENQGELSNNDEESLTWQLRRDISTRDQYKNLSDQEKLRAVLMSSKDKFFSEQKEKEEIFPSH